VRTRFFRRPCSRALAPTLLAAAALAITIPARAEDTPAPASTPASPAQVDLEKDTKASLEGDLPGPLPEAPPAAPYKKTLVLDSAIGARAFLGEFGKVAPPGVWLHTQLGYELLRWLMVFGEGDLSFSDTSREQDPPQTRAFPIFGFGAGVRGTLRFTDRVGVYLQGSAGLMKADIRVNALRIIGFADAESLGVYTGGRLGVEWLQLDRHMALGLNGGVKLAQGFARVRGSDTPLALDGGLSLRYAF
jgi:hypothetical protein